MASGLYAPLVTTRVSGYDFGAPMPPGGWIGTGESFGVTKHPGSDIGTPAGSPIFATADSSVSFQTGVGQGLGNLLTEKFSNGWEFLFGHVAGGASGSARAGQQIGVTGANVGDAQGAVTLFMVKNPKGVNVNPDPILAALSGSKASASQVFGMASGGGGTYAQQLAAGLPQGANPATAPAPGSALLGLNSSDPLGIDSAVTSVGHGLADFLVVAEQDIADWMKRQAVAFFVAAVVLLVLFL